MKNEVEVDQSGKVEDTRVDTVLAFADGESRAALIPAKAKRVCLEWLRRRKPKSPAHFLKIFAAGLFLLLQDHLDRVEYITIDIEYTGREAELKGMLLDLIRTERPKFAKERITFRRIGKKSPAHRQAIMVYRGQDSPDITLHAEDIIEVLEK